MTRFGLAVLVWVGLLVLLLGCSQEKTDIPLSDGDQVVDGDPLDADLPELDQPETDAALADGDRVEAEREPQELEAEDSQPDGDTEGNEAIDGDSQEGAADREPDAEKESEAEQEEALSAALGSISVADLHAILTTGTKSFKLINVHTPNEGEIAATDTHIDYRDTTALKTYIGSDLSTSVVVYCMSNYMSQIAGNNLVGLGYRAVRYLDGGMRGWQQAGYTLQNVP